MAFSESDFRELKNAYTFYRSAADHVLACHAALAAAIQKFEEHRRVMNRMHGELSVELDAISSGVAPAPPPPATLIARAIRIKDEIDEAVK